MGGAEGKIHTFSFSALIQQAMQERAILGKLMEWVHSSNSISIFVTGKTGSGKSTLVNALIGEDVAEEGDIPDPMTAKVKCYKRDRSGVTIKVWDSPGLQDGTGNEVRYIRDMQANCKNIDLYLLCVNIGDSVRFNKASPEIQAIKKLTDAFGPSMWENAAIALTFANEIHEKNQPMSEVQEKIARAENRIAFLEREGKEEETKDAEQKLQEEKDKLKELFCGKIREWDEKLRELLKDEIKIESARVDALRIIPTGYREPLSLPDRPHWLSSFWFSVLLSTHRRAQPALLFLNRKRIVESRDQVSEKDVEKHLHDQLIIFTEMGAEVGGACGNSDWGSVLGLKLAQVQSLILLERMLLNFFYKVLSETQEKPSEIESSQCGGR